ncbi:glycosyl transferase [Sulfuricella sp. T08]|uniref:glycosyltransferase family 2 protein n=1 Tax=Sulfuricella sp. T08 TaxID=1632857 RepID=UPI0006179B41|nr:glycosyltransferase family 2 protein [Sulfuricella sp. T08]GAO34683.1 glycosyl transferase [Sulfuricella sp. T08]
MTVLSAILGTLSVLILVPVTVLLVQVLMALPAYRHSPLPQGRRSPVGILIPAHDEADVIAATLGSILPQLTEGDRLLVVADNCSDETAAIVRGLGAEVVERTDLERRGKGYALDFGVGRMRDDPPEVVIIIDADCQVFPGTIDRLARTCVAASCPVQSLDLMLSPEGACLKTRIAEFAWLVKNQVRPLGFYRLGLSCQLMGTGMAFPWSLISNAALASGHIVEDMKFGIDLALAGYPALFCPDATVTSYFPSDKTAEGTQRTRWEHGHLSMILHEFPRVLACAIRERNVRLLGLAIDLVVPPLALLALIVTAIFSLNLMLFLFEGITWPLNLSLITLGLFAIAITIAWYGWGRKVISFLAMLTIPFYILSKTTLYLRFLTKRQKSWVKTERD